MKAETVTIEGMKFWRQSDGSYVSVPAFHAGYGMRHRTNSRTGSQDYVAWIGLDYSRPGFETAEQAAREIRKELEASK